MDDQQMNPPAEPAAQQTPPQEDELAKAKAQADEYLAGWKRATADYANLKKDHERERTELSKYAVAGLVGKLLPTIDSFHKATEQRPIKEGEPLDEKRLGPWIDGIGHIRAQLEAALAAAGVSVIDKADVPFDPATHEPMMMEKREGAASGTVLKVLESGYKLHDRVIKPAKVIVAE